MNKGCCKDPHSFVVSFFNWSNQNFTQSVLWCLSVESKWRLEGQFLCNQTLTLHLRLWYTKTTTFEFRKVFINVNISQRSVFISFVKQLHANIDRKGLSYKHLETAYRAVANRTWRCVTLRVRHYVNSHDETRARETSDFRIVSSMLRTENEQKRIRRWV